MNLPASMLAGVKFDRWPLIWLPRGVSGVAVVAGTTTAVTPFRIPANRRVVGLLVVAQSGLVADTAAIELRIQDEEGDDLIFDTDNRQAAIGSFTVPALALSGIQQARQFALDRVVREGAYWNFTVQNRGAVDITPIVALFLDPEISP